jgi:hypothetical protein
VSDTSDTLPVIKASQGRSEEDIAAEVRMSVLLVILTLILIAVVVAEAVLE